MPPALRMGSDKPRRLPPTWWIKLRIKSIQTPGIVRGYKASYKLFRNEWSVTSENKAEARDHLIKWLEEVKK